MEEGVEGDQQQRCQYREQEDSEPAELGRKFIFIFVFLDE